MKPRVVLTVLIAWQCAVACIVPTFEVDSTSSTQGGTSATGGTGRAGDQAFIGGKASLPVTGGAGDTNGAGEAGLGGASEGQGGTRSTQTGGSPSTGGISESPGGAGGSGADPFPGPALVGYSMFHDSASGDSHANGKLIDATFTMPQGTQPGDFMLVFFGADHNLQNLSLEQLELSNWTLQDQHEGYGTDGQGMYLMYKFVGAGEPESIVFAGINPQLVGVQGLLSVYRGVNRTAPIDFYDFWPVDEGTDGPTHILTPTPEVTTTVDNCLLVAGLSPDTAIDAPRITSWPDGFDLHPISVTNPRTPYPYGWANIYTAERQVEAAGTVPASAFAWDITYDGTLYYGALSFVIALSP